MLPIVKRNDSWVLVFNILCGLAFYFLTCEPTGRFSPISIVFIILVLCQGVFVNVLLERFALLPQKSHVPQFITGLVLIGTISYTNVSYKLLIAYVLQQIVLFSLLIYNDKTSQNQKHQVFLFNQAILLSISCFLYPSFIYGIIAFFISFSTLFGIQLKQIFVFMMGLLFPAIYYLSYLYLFDVSKYALTFQKISAFFTLEQAVFVVFVSVFSTVGIYNVFVKLSNKNISVRKSFQILFLYSIVPLVSFIIQPNIPVLVLMSSTCVVFVLSFVFLNPKKPWLATFLFWILLLVFFLRLLSIQETFAYLMW